MKRFNAITDVPGIKVGHASDFKGLTGCTVILCEEGATGGVDIRGAATGTRQIDALNLLHVVDKIHGVLLTGGSSFGLDAAGGVMTFLEERGKGFDVTMTKVPIVPAAVIFDLGIGDSGVRPNHGMGYEACLKASKRVEEGSVGAGTGATVGKLFGIDRAMKGGLGTSSILGPDGLVVGALAVVNAFGDVLDPESNQFLAGARSSKGSSHFANSSKWIRKGVSRKSFGTPVSSGPTNLKPPGHGRGLPGKEISFRIVPPDPTHSARGGTGLAGHVPVNTTLGIVATNANLSKKECHQVAQISQSGLAKVISPIHTTFDGDLVFAISYGKKKADVNTVGLLGEAALIESVKRAILEADGFGVIPAYKDIHLSSPPPGRGGKGGG